MGCGRAFVGGLEAGGDEVGVRGLGWGSEGGDGEGAGGAIDADCLEGGVALHRLGDELDEAEIAGVGGLGHGQGGG